MYLVYSVQWLDNVVELTSFHCILKCALKLRLCTEVLDGNTVGHLVVPPACSSITSKSSNCFAITVSKMMKREMKGTAPKKNYFFFKENNILVFSTQFHFVSFSYYLPSDYILQNILLLVVWILCTNVALTLRKTKHLKMTGKAEKGKGGSFCTRLSIIFLSDDVIKSMNK